MALRAARPDPALPRYHGASGPTEIAAQSVTAIETYLQCPFRYFASRVLGLEEERPDEPGLDPRQRGTFEHAVFERFFREWEGDGLGAITASLVPAARDRFHALVEEMVLALPDADRAVERVRLLGSPLAPGVGDRVFRLEAQHATPVVARKLEVDLGGPYEFNVADRTVRASLRGVADRIDLLADGTLRVLDYKSGRAPDVKRAIQLPVYGYCAERRLTGELGRNWRLGEAAYIAFGEKRPFVDVIASQKQRDEVVPDALGRLVGAIEAIGRGEFPPRPDKRSLCTTCAFASVCRRDYVDAG
jgi:CRISPR/Cas system-associated exonuclease Cas4 (RecB family)